MEQEKELEQKINDLYLFCLANKIPMFAIFANETEKETKYENLVITPHDVGIKLTDDKITKYSASLNKNFELRFKAAAKSEDSFENIIDSFSEWPNIN